MEAMGEEMLQKHGTRLFYPSDEFFIKAGSAMPDAAYYGDMAQLENGVGMTALLEEQFREALAAAREEGRRPAGSRLLIATGLLAAPILSRLVDEARETWHNLLVEVVPIKNRFFGETITVAGLLTGRDLMEQLRCREADILSFPGTCSGGRATASWTTPPPTRWRRPCRCGWRCCRWTARICWKRCSGNRSKTDRW